MISQFTPFCRNYWKHIVTGTIVITALYFNCLNSEPPFQSSPPTIHKAVYAWENNLYISEKTDSLLKQKNFSRIYSKVLEIEWNAIYHAAPTVSNTIHYEQKNLPQYDYVPVIFITNEAILLTPLNEVPELASKIVTRLETLCEIDSIKEIQIDCDWSKKSKRNYFALITALKKELPKKTVSVTLRLHQYKNREQQGIPPADKCMLMLYNMGKITNPDEKNSIYNHDLTLEYINGTPKYPIPLDVALPSFSWSAVFRNKTFYEINHSIDQNYADTCSAFTKLLNGKYFVNKDYLDTDDGYLRYGDEVRVESIGAEDLLKATSLARRICNSNEMTLSFFDMNSNIFIHEITEPEYEKLFDCFK